MGILCEERAELLDEPFFEDLVGERQLSDVQQASHSVLTMHVPSGLSAFRTTIGEPCSIAGLKMMVGRRVSRSEFKSTPFAEHAVGRDDVLRCA